LFYMTDKDKFYGYTIDQIRDLDRWRNQYNINPDLIGSAYADGWRAGFKASQEYTEELIKSQIHHMNTNMPLDKK
jgi:hypothetical protein